MEPDDRIDGRGAFEDAVRAAFAEASVAGWRELYLCDADFAHWPLGERAVIDSLSQWIGGGRRLTLIALHFDEVVRRHPRWLQWRRQWAHVVDCRVAADVPADDMPTLLLAPGALSLEVADTLRWQGRISRDAAVAIRVRERIDAILQRSVESVPVTTLGL